MPALAGSPLLLPPLPALPLGRVAVRSVEVRKEPDPQAPGLATLPKDLIVQVMETVEADAPAGNPRWLKIREGYIHGGDIQPVEFHPQIPSLDIRQIVPAEVSVPITQSYKTVVPREEILYRLYYKSVHWVTGVQVGQDDRIWYTLLDQQLGLHLFAPGEHLRLLQTEEYAPLAAEVPPLTKWIEVRLARQELTAFEGEAAVRTARVSSGMALGGEDTLTPHGEFNVQNKIAAMHMGNGRVTSDPLAYELPGVPWVCIFEPKNGVALHGTYWHNDFGRSRSHGCLNLSPDDALWLYRWTSPPAPDGKLKGTIGLGTRIIIR
jgi:lipoprotein-anchoring transpeptidase ErfK/SrfK